MSKEESKYPFNLVDNANEDLKKYNKEIQIVINDDDGYYSVDILTIGPDGPDGRIRNIETFAENLFESELPDCVNDAWANVRKREWLKEQRKTPRNVPDTDSLYAKVCNALSHYEEIREGSTEEMYMALADVHDWMERNVINQ